MNLESVGLKERIRSMDGDKRTELRLASTEEFVAWCRSTDRRSDGERIVNASIQIIHRQELTPEQISAVKQWLLKKVAAAL